jgi:acetyltransferase-like isoleucine patch superfamily enzyme
MSNYYTYDELKECGIEKLGADVRISRKASLYQGELMEFGDNVRVDDFCILSGKLIFGSHIHITPFCLVAGAKEGIFFEDFTTLAYRCTVFTRNDDYRGETLANSTIPEKYRTLTEKKEIHIRKYAIVGACSIVFPGAHIEEGVSIGASSLVLQPTKPWGIYVGVPAKRIKERKRDLIEQGKGFVREYRRGE